MGIELCRGIAAIMVMLTHYAVFIPGAPTGMGYLWTGVDFFFVISGYVFSPLLLQSSPTGLKTTPDRDKGTTLALVPFWTRRFFRIYPLYLLALLAYFLVLPATDTKLGYFVRHLFFLHTTRSFEEAYFFNPAFWSLPVEIEYYLLLPALALLRNRKPWLLALVGVSVLLSLTVNYLRGPADLLRILSVHLPGILPEFMVGTFLAYMVREAVARQQHWRSPQALASFGLGLWLVVFTYQVKYGGLGLEDSLLLDAPWNLLCAIAFALLSYPLLLIPNEHYGKQWARLAVLSGASSYGVYLFHNLMPHLFRAAGLPEQGLPIVLAYMAASLGLALLLYRLYENPFRKYGRQLSKSIYKDASSTTQKV